MKFQKILVALNRSSLESAVFEQSIDLAKTNQANLMLVHCLDVQAEVVGTPQAGASAGVGLYPTVGSGAYPPLAENVQPTPQDWERKFKEAQDWLQSYYQKAMNLEIPTEYECRVGEAGPQICQLAEDWNADLVVLGRKGYTGLTEALLGSVSNYVFHHAPCSVMVVQGEMASPEI